MQNGYYDATGGMVTQFNRLDVISNNLANLNTTAFKRDDVVIGDFKRIFEEYQEQMPIKDNTKEAAKFLNHTLDEVPHIVEQYTKYDQGGLKATGNNLDFALKRGDAFFMVETPQGLRLTQDGSFVINDEGTLTTKEGYPVIPKDYFKNKQYIKVPQDASLVSDKSGNLFVNGENAGKFYIATTDDIKSLQKEGNKLFKFQDVNDLQDLGNDDVIAQGFVETSNINPVSEMVGLIEANRMVEMYQKVMTAHMNDVNQDAINKLASTKA